MHAFPISTMHGNLPKPSHTAMLLGYRVKLHTGLLSSYLVFVLLSSGDLVGAAWLAQCERFGRKS